MKGIIYAAAVSSFVLAACTSCTHDGLPGAEVPDDGCIEIRFDADIPPMPVVATRSVDPDGTGVQNMTLFCFDRRRHRTTCMKARSRPACRRIRA